MNLTDLFLKRIYVTKLLDRISGIDMRDRFDKTQYDNYTFDGAIDALDELDTTIQNIREAGL